MTSSPPPPPDRGFRAGKPGLTKGFHQRSQSGDLARGGTQEGQEPRRGPRRQALQPKAASAAAVRRTWEVG